MPNISADRVKETTTTTGTGALTLAGAVSGFRAFSSVMAANDTCFYVIDGGTEWEVGQGTYNTTLARNTVFASSNSNALVSFSAGTKTVALTAPAEVINDPVDPTAPYFIADDFIGGSVETGEIGDFGWSFTNGSITKLNGIQAHPGTVRNTGSTTANQVCSFYLANAVGDTICRFDEFDECTFVFKEAAASQTDMTLQMGVINPFGNTTPTHGCYLEIKPADSNYFFVCRNTGAETRTDSGVARSTNWIKVRIRRINSSTVRFNINGGADVDITANIPDAADALGLGKQSAQTGTTARNIDIDWFSFKMLGISR